MSKFNDTIRQINPQILTEARYKEVAKTPAEVIALFSNPNIVYLAGYEEAYEGEYVFGIGSSFIEGYEILKRYQEDPSTGTTEFFIDLYILNDKNSGFDSQLYRVEKDEITDIIIRLSTHKGLSEDEIEKIPEL